MTRRGLRKSWSIPIIRLSQAAALCLLLAPHPALAELQAVWALDDGTKVKADELDHPLEGGNGVFSTGPARVHLFGARNETVAFQVILEGGSSPTSQIRVELPSIGPIKNQETSDDPDSYLLGRHIELLRQHYVEVKQRSHAIPWDPYSAAQPKGMMGWVPDALIPLPVDRTLTVPAGRNQGIWVDIYIPNDVPPGTYDGTITIRVGDQACGLAACNIAVTLDVLPLSLPDRSTVKTMIYFSGSDDDRDCMPARYFARPWEVPDAKIEALRARHFKLARRHRLTLFLGHDAHPTPALQTRISGKAFSRQHGYHGPGEGIGQDMYSIHSYGGKLTPAQAQTWHDWFATHGPDTTVFLYTHDEPHHRDFPMINRVARQADPIPAFVTASYQPGLDVDIYAALADSYSVKQVMAARTAGGEGWIYNGVRPFTGSLMIDDVAISPRVNPWIQYKYGIPRWFYWEATYYKDSQGDRGNIDVWSEAINFSNASGDKLNGDGLLLYPGRDLLYPDHDQGIDAPLPSIRLKNWRRGIEDVEYLVIARKRGHGDIVDQLLDTLIPRALTDETESGAPVSWPEDGEKWLLARRTVAMLLTRKSAPAIDLEALAALAEPMFKRAKRRVRGLLRKVGRRRLFVLGLAGLAGNAALLFWWRRRRRLR